MSIRKGDIRKFKKMIEDGSDIHFVNGNDVNLLMVAAINRQYEIVKILIERGINIHAVDSDKWNALMYATLHGYIDIIRILIEKGADINAVNKDGETALMLAGDSKRDEIAKLLLDHGANINDIFHLRDKRIVNCMKVFKHEIEERRHLLTEENLKKWKRMRLASLFQ